MHDELLELQQQRDALEHLIEERREIISDKAKSLGLSEAAVEELFFAEKDRPSTSADVLALVGKGWISIGRPFTERLEHKLHNDPGRLFSLDRLAEEFPSETRAKISSTLSNLVKEDRVTRVARGIWVSRPPGVVRTIREPDGFSLWLQNRLAKGDGTVEEFILVDALRNDDESLPFQDFSTFCWLSLSTDVLSETGGELLPEEATLALGSLFEGWATEVASLGYENEIVRLEVMFDDDPSLWIFPSLYFPSDGDTLSFATDLRAIVSDVGHSEARHRLTSKWPSVLVKVQANVDPC